MNQDGGAFLGLFPITPQDESVITSSFYRAERFWSHRYPKLVGITATRLVILKDDAVFNCPSPEGKPEITEATDPNGTQYCQTLGRIVITQGLVNYLSGMAPNIDPLLTFFEYHEEGHALQAANGTLHPGIRTTLKMERQADCDAGLAVKATVPSDISAIEAFLPRLPSDDPRHGTPEQRLASFEKGVAGGPC